MSTAPDAGEIARLFNELGDLTTEAHARPGAFEGPTGTLATLLRERGYSQGAIDAAAEGTAMLDGMLGELVRHLGGNLE